MQRWERTRHLIVLGELVKSAGLVDLAVNDRAALYGALLKLAARAQDGAVYRSGCGSPPRV